MVHMNKMTVVLVTPFLVGILVFSALFLMWRYPVWGMFEFKGEQNSISIDRAAELANDYLESLGNNDLAIDEIMEFEFNFYIVYYEKSTGIGAFESIIDKQGAYGMMGIMGSGYVRPEQGPNMMWNIKYGMRMMYGAGITSGTTIGEDDAREYAQRYLDEHFTGSVVGDVHQFYGYYTVHVVTDNKVSGMVSVNGYDRQIWYHNWHGKYIQTLEMR